MQDDNENKFLDNMSKLQWACRRGMLELDVLLGNFLNEAYAGLTKSDKELFITYLSQSDPELFAWLMGHGTPTDPDLKRMTDMIRQHAKSRF